MKLSYILFFILISHIGICDKYVWNMKAPFPSFARHRCAAFSIGNKGYMGIGHINSGGISDDYQDWWEFDPATNSWSQKADYPKNRYGTATFVIGNKGYMGTGRKQGGPDQQEFYEYDPITNIWTQKTDFPIISGGNVGFSINNYGYMGLSTGVGLYKYDPIIDSWSAVTTTITADDYSSCFVINNKAYIQPAYTNSLVMYDPATGLSIGKANFIGLTRYGACSFSLKNIGYVGLGAYLTDYKDFYYYDPVLDSWDTIPKAFPGVRRHYVPSFVIGDNAFFGTGTNGTNLGDMWGYEWKVSVGVSKIQNENDIIIYPNPAHEFITISISENNLIDNSVFKIFNLTGQEVLTQTIYTNKTLIDVKPISKGIYVYTLINRNKTISKKIIIN